MIYAVRNQVSDAAEDYVRVEVQEGVVGQVQRNGETQTPQRDLHEMALDAEALSNLPELPS